MRTLCSVDASFWPAVPVQGGSACLPPWMIETMLETLLASTLGDHQCHSTAPCAAFRADVQVYLRLLLVCKSWNLIISRNLPRNFDRLFDQNEREIYRASDCAFHHSLTGRYRGYQIIEDESLKSVMRGYDYGGPAGCYAKQNVIIKVSARANRHENEETFYNWLGCSNAEYHSVPRLHYHGPYPRPYSELYNGLVLDALGPDLERLRSKCRGERFTPKMTLAVAIQTIRIYERLHEQGWLHTNAKPGNFAIGPDEPGKSHKIYMFDFEYSHRIRLKMPKKGTNDGWNRDFSSVSWQLGLPPCRRDDLEGLGYVLSYLERGECLWSDPCHSENSVWREKLSMPAKKLFEGMDPAYVRYFNEVKTLAWGEIPDYQEMVRRFAEVWERKGYGGTPGEINWWEECDLKSDHANS